MGKSIAETPEDRWVRQRREDMRTRGHNLRHRRILAFAASFIIGAALLGCGQTPVGPTAPEDPPVTPFDIRQGYVASDLVSVDSSVVWTQGWVTVARGGVVPLGMPGKYHDLIVAPGSVTQDVLIQVKTTTYYYPGQKVVTFDFGPDGLVFSSPAKMKVDASIFGPGKVSSVTLFYFDPLRSEWVIQQVAKVVKSSVTFDIRHFSKYAIS